jgi:YegS/Rv2252/BmrU family lipid kinase
MPSITAVIVNTSAGSAVSAGTAAELTEKFRAHGVEVQVTMAQTGEQMAQAAQQAIRQKAPAVIAGGGDGSINAVASILAGSGTALGVLPLGTLNHFAKDLHIPLEPDAAIRTIAEGRRRAVDVGEVNGRIFLNNSSLGLYPDIVRDREKQQQRLGRGKWPAFFWAVIAALRRYPFLNVRLTVDGRELERRTPFIFVGNNEYSMTGFEIGTRARLDDGLLSLYVAQRPGRFGLLRFAFSALLGRLKQEKDFDVFNTQQIGIETQHRHLQVSTDGEVTSMQTPLLYRIRPAALDVIVPRDGMRA